MRHVKCWIIVVASAVLVPGLVAAGPEKLGPGTIDAELALRRQAWISNHVEPGMSVNWHTEGGQWETDENGNQQYVCLLLAAIVPTAGEEEGRLLTAQLEVYYDPATDSVRSRRYRKDGKVGWDYQRAPADEIAQLFPASAPFVESELQGPDDLDFGDLPMGTGLTQYIDPLYGHKQELEAILAEIKAAGPRPADDREAREWALDLKETGGDALSEVRGFSRTLNAFIDPRTRAGLREEIDLAQETVKLVEQVVESYGVAAQYQPKPVSISDRDLVRDALVRELRPRIAERLGKEFESEGLAEALNSDSLQEALDKTITRVDEKLARKVGDFTEEHTGLRFYDGSTFRAAVKQRVHEELKQRVAEVLLKVTSNSILIEIVGEPIIWWLENDLWPRLRELFRQKGNHDARVATSVASLDRARLRLYQLPPDALLRDVQATLNSAEGSVKATRYLVGDLQRAKRDDLLLGQMEPARKRLVRAADITKQRFFLHRLGDLEDLQPSAERVAALVPTLQEMINSVRVPQVAADEDEGDQQRPDRPELVRFDPPVYLLHIVEVGTINGPVKVDQWMLWGENPQGEWIHEADGTGGYIGKRWDKNVGSFSSNYELGPKLAQLGIGGIYYGRTWITGDPKVWGE